jgi:hypothetical protein
MQKPGFLRDQITYGYTTKVRGGLRAIKQGARAAFVRKRAINRKLGHAPVGKQAHRLNKTRGSSAWGFRAASESLQKVQVGDAPSRVHAAHR